MKKVLIVGPSTKLKGGIATVIKNYKSFNFTKDNIDISYMATIFSNNKYINILNFPIIIVFYLISILKKDIIHIHMASYGSFKRKAILLKIAKSLNKKVILHIHGAEFHLFYEQSSNEYKEYIRTVLNKADNIIALSHEWKVRLSEITKTPISVIYNSVNVPNQNLYNNDGKSIIFMGRMDKRKGIYDLLDIAKEIEKIGKDLIITLCGDGEIDKVISIIKSRGLKNVMVLGWVDQIKKEEVLRDAVINILPSYNEGMPMSILEAMSMGIPTISTDVGGIPEIIKSTENGFLIRPGDKKAMIKAIETIIKNNELRGEISTNSYETIYKKFNIETHINSLLRIYNKV